ncbi:MAG TPA: Gfo/Idh/MocA family oxidoreductase [Caulobacteraceae bacterium]|nr:Gfo/Idh/MocA family oxidoreductase [Caulobacteraceae bacterium]
MSYAQRRRRAKGRPSLPNDGFPSDGFSPRLPFMGDAAAQRVLKIGVAGLGRAFLLTAPALIGDPRVKLIAAADPRPEARARFEAELGRAYDDIEGLAHDRDVELIYVASPHRLHAPHAIAAARAGKHVLVEKPMALSLEDCRAMIAAANEAGVRLMVGPSHAYDAPVALASRLIASGDYGAPRMVAALNYTDFLYRPRHAEELDTSAGGGVVFNQAPHQVDIVRRLIGSPVSGVRATTGAWDPGRPTEGAYNAFLAFESGASASLTYSGYDRFDSDELMGWVGELGLRKAPDRHGAARRKLSDAGRLDRAYGASGLTLDQAGRLHEHFGVVIVSCERADLRTTPEGVVVYGDDGAEFHPAQLRATPRAELIDEIVDVVIGGQAPLFSGEWGRSTLQVCLAMLRSSAEGREVRLESGG